MMLVASLFISGSYDKIAGYAPGSQVTDHNAVDLDQAVMESYLGAGDFVKAKDVYEKGGNSKSYALLTVPATAKNIKKGAAMTATDQSGNSVSGKSYDDYAAGSTSIRFQYSTGNTQWNADDTPGYNDCRAGGSARKIGTRRRRGAGMGSSDEERAHRNTRRAGSPKQDGGAIFGGVDLRCRCDRPDLG